MKYDLYFTVKYTVEAQDEDMAKAKGYRYAIERPELGQAISLSKIEVSA